MKKFLLLILFIFTLNINAQVAIPAHKAVLQNEVSFPKDQPVDVRLLFPDFEKSTMDYLKANPNGLLKNRLNKTSFDYIVGSTRDLYAADLTTDGSDPYLVPSTCRAVGEHCYIFVENASWAANKVTQAEVDSVKKAFDSSTPANATTGIYTKNVEVFGNPPNKDGDSKVIIFILDIKDGYTPGHAYTIGYFFSRDQTDNYGSNQGEIFYLDCYPLNLKSSGGLQTGRSTLAHEFQHMINFNYHDGQIWLPGHTPLQETFLNEGCSLIAEYVNGYPFREQSGYANDIAVELFEWRRNTDQVLNDYSRAARFMLYYYEQFGIDFLKKLVQSSYVGITGVNDALSKLTTSTNLEDRKFADILPDWYLANTVDNKSVNNKWGYTLTGLAKPQGNVYWSANVNSYSVIVPNLGVQIITHKGSNDLNSVFSNYDFSNHSIKAIKFGSGNPVVEDVTLNSTLNSTYSVPTLNGTYTAVQYLVMNGSITTPLSFQYSATGTNPPSTELSYSVNPAVGAFNWTAGDTVCVYFDGINMGKLDSLKIQFRESGSITGGIWEFTGSQLPTPLGKKILTNMQANPVIISDAYSEWTKIDLRSFNISTTKPFAVAFPVAANKPRVMVSEFAASNSYHSYTYLVPADDVPSSGWYYVTKDAETIYIYHIKAYISVGTLGNEEIREVLPSNYTLAQNYPNPFNPTTKINFTLPEASKVTIRIYDMLGREVKTLVDAQHSAGTHQVEWHGDDNSGQRAATGVYLYALSTNKMLITKKMILMK